MGPLGQRDSECRKDCETKKGSHLGRRRFTAARGKTVNELNKTVSERLQRYISDAVVTISVQEIKGNKIFVLGQVNKPGEFIVNPSVNIMQALSMAGGMTPFAATNDIIVLRGQGTQQKAMAFRYNDVVRGRSLDTNIELLSGDIVVVP